MHIKIIKLTTSKCEEKGKHGMWKHDAQMFDGGGEGEKITTPSSRWSSDLTDALPVPTVWRKARYIESYDGSTGHGVRGVDSYNQPLGWTFHCTFVILKQGWGTQTNWFLKTNTMKRTFKKIIPQNTHIRLISSQYFQTIELIKAPN